MKGIKNGGARDSEKFLNPSITSVTVSVNGVPNKVYSQGIEGLDMWNEALRHFGKYDSDMNATRFYAQDKFGLFIDLRSIRDQE